MRSQTREKPWESGIASPLRRVLVGAFFLWVASCGTRADVVTDWNAAMTAYAAQVDAPSGALLPNVETRIYAMAHIAMLEAIKEAQSTDSRGKTGFAPADQKTKRSRRNQ